MPRFAANLSMMFTEWDFLDRFKAAADAGFEAVEFLFPYEHAPEKIGLALAGAEVEQALFNLPPGDWAKGERGMAAIPGREEEFRAGIEAALPYVHETGVKRLHMMAGHADPQDPAAQKAYRAALAYAADKLAEHDIDLLLEPINGKDMPGYFLNDFDQAAAYVRESGRRNVRLQFDMYHCELIHGDVSGKLKALYPLIGHVQIARANGRHEPDASGPDYPRLFDELDRLGYEGFVGCEYRPAAGTLEGLGWFSDFRKPA
ncbi:2-oxo-tetronate isomerase [Bosea psychrotolerans]|uniref:Hydroxypyruvate isomerase n=1 Tax=Bosea psychrotolerans TaxID=1871628 RepID=A0A2S4MQS0_9HYPH|nr:2-oxo-tetronate isomerase [Bosea psychrotolerans]POR56647.1 hydroxypyruvate isomerase [Bosea psychrotolerans]